MSPGRTIIYHILEEAVYSFSYLKSATTRSFVIAVDDKVPFTVVTHESYFAIGATPWQEDSYSIQTSEKNENGIIELSRYTFGIIYFEDKDNSGGTVIIFYEI